MTLTTVKIILLGFITLSVSLSLHAYSQKNEASYIFNLSIALFFFLAYSHPQALLVKSIYELDTHLQKFKAIDHTILWTSIGLSGLALLLKPF